MPDLSKLFVVIGAKTDEFETQMKGVTKNLQKVGAVMTGVGAGITGAMALSIKSFAKAGDEVQKMAQKTGFSTESLSELRYAAELSGTSLEGIETGVKRMQSTLIDASDGLATATLSLDKLGLSYEMLKGLSPEEQFLAITSAIANVEDPTLKAALAVDIFGRSGTDMLPMLAGGSEGLAAMRQEAHDLGIVFDQEAANKAAGFNDALTTMGKGMEGLKFTIAETLIPALMPLIEKISDIFKRIGEWTKAHPGLTRVILLVVGAIGALMLVVGPLLMALPLIISGVGIAAAVFAAILSPIGLVVLAIAGLIAAGILIWKNWDTIKEKAIEIWNAIKDFVLGIWENIKSGISIAIGWVRDHLDIIMPIIASILLGPFAGLLIWIILNRDKVVEFFQFVKEKLQSIWGSLVGITGKIWDGIVAAIKSPINVIIGMINGLISAMETMLNSIADVVNSIPTFKIPGWVPGIGGKEFGLPKIPTITLPRVPLMAHGGDILEPTLLYGLLSRQLTGIAGEAGPERVVPGGGELVIHNYIYLGDRQIAEVLGRASYVEEQVRSR